MSSDPQNYRFAQFAVTIPNGKSVQVLSENLNRQALYLHCVSGDPFYINLEQGPQFPSTPAPGIVQRSVTINDAVSQPRQFIFTPVNAITITNTLAGAAITVIILEGFFPPGCGCKSEFQNYRFTTSAMTLDAGFSQNALPENLKRRALYIYSAIEYLVALEQGPTTPQPLVTGIVNRSIPGSFFGSVPCPWFNVPVNAVTLTNNSIVSSNIVILEGFAP